MGEQCGKVILQHCSPTPHPSSAEGAESEGEYERGLSQRGKSRGVKVEGSESEGKISGDRGLEGYINHRCINSYFLCAANRGGAAGGLLQEGNYGHRPQRGRPG